MADQEFDRDGAARKQREIMGGVERVREYLYQQVNRYYAERRPRDADEERRYRRDLYSIIKNADSDIHKLLDELY